MNGDGWRAKATDGWRGGGLLFEVKRTRPSGRPTTGWVVLWDGRGRPMNDPSNIQGPIGLWRSF